MFDRRCLSTKEKREKKERREAVRAGRIMIRSQASCAGV